MKAIILTAILMMTMHIAYAQESIIKINPEIKLPEDSTDCKRLLASLNQFLVSAQKDATKNNWVYPPQYLQTTVLLDEIEGLEKDKTNKESCFYQPYLIGVIPIEEEKYFIQISYIGVAKEAPITRANVELIAHKSEDKYLFSSPLVRNTKTGKQLR